MAALVAALALATPAWGFELGALPAELVTDRPDQTESALVVPAGSLQVETGALVTHEAAGADAEWTRESPGTLLRYGLGHRLELRLAWPGRVESEPSGGAGGRTRAGLGDPALGIKVALADGSDGGPETALLVHASLPIGDEGFGSPRSDLSARLAMSHALGTRSALGWNLGLEGESIEDERGNTHTLARWVYTAALGFDLGARWGAFVEVFGDLPASDRERPAHSLDGGVTLRLRPGLQLDASAGWGVAGGAPDFFAGLGLAFRLDR